MDQEIQDITLKDIKTYAKKSTILDDERWKHRRRMAYISLAAVMLVTYWCLFEIEVERVKALDTIITWFYIIMGSVVGAFVGFATLDDKWKGER
jgi:hypothetical protein